MYTHHAPGPVLAVGLWEAALLKKLGAFVLGVD